MIYLTLFIIFFAAAFTQGFGGFGFSLVAMPFLVILFGIRVAAPLGAIAGTAAILPLMYRYRASIEGGSLWRLALATVVAVPVGVASIGWIDADFLKQVLGMLLIFYAGYALLNLSVPEIAASGWDIGFGLISGLLGGALNASGPPVIIYGDMRRWQPAVFKANLQGLFLVTAMTIVASHAARGSFTGPVFQMAVAGAPGIFLGQWWGARLSDRLPQVVFRRVVLVLLLAIGIRLQF